MSKISHYIWHHSELIRWFILTYTNCLNEMFVEFKKDVKKFWIILYRILHLGREY